MNPDQFVEVFDVRKFDLATWTGPAIGMIFVMIGLGMVVAPRILRAAGIPFLDGVRGPVGIWGGSKLFRYGFLAFATVWTAGVASITTMHDWRYRTMLEQHSCRIIEGQVEHFVPMPYGGHGNESFSVRGVPFKYSDFVITGGFNNTASHGGPITRDAYVRICYDPSNNLILRLEIRGLDLATAARPSFWPTPSAQRAADRDADHAFDEQTWLGFSIFAIWLVDLAGIFTLYRPYLGTFLRLGGIADRFMLRPNLEAETAIKLSHCLIYWDRPGRTIWLRPRGLVLFQIPSVVAKIDIDADDRTVLGWTIRLSSGSAVIVALMIVALYWTLLAMASAGKGPPIPIVAGFGVIIIVILAINLRLLRSRMMGLMESALPELGA